MTSIRNIITTAVFTGIFSCSILALAEEPAPDHSLSAAVSVSDNTSVNQDSWILEADITYDLDLDVDGTSETFSFQSHTDNSEDQSKATLDLYVNGKPVWSVTDEDWSYGWRVSRCPVENASACLIAASISDNDWTNQVLLLAKTEDSFKVLADLTELSRSTDTDTDRLLSGWARADSITAADETSFTVDWYDTLYSAGMLKVPVTYEIADGTVTQSEDITPLDDSQTWTVWHGFDVMDNPENGMSVYQTSPGEILHLTGLKLISGRRWIRCENSSGDSGWFMDPEEFISETQDDGSMLFGYFKEAMFVG